jgi:NADH:ubiquinone oxidoreductase subunit 6 (subunit J)
MRRSAVKVKSERAARVQRRAAIAFAAMSMLVMLPFATTTLRSSANARQGTPSTAPARVGSAGGLGTSGTARFNPIVDVFIALAIAGTIVAIIVTRRRTVTARAAARQ